MVTEISGTNSDIKLTYFLFFFYLTSFSNFAQQISLTLS
jgi:hypothetical protein